MVTLWRAVTTSSAYPAVRGKLLDRKPDDVWHDSTVGWLLSFPYAGAGAESIVIFVIGHVAERGMARLRRAVVVDRRDDGVTTDVIYEA